MEQTESQSLSLPVSDRDHIRGSIDAPVTLVVYADFECPSCGDFYSVTREVQDQLGRRLRMAFRHFPLNDQHPHAQLAAEASEAAAAQGEEKFWLMHDRLYKHQKALSREDLITHAADIELDTQKFTRELDEGKYQDRVREDILSGERSGVHGTPTVFIDGEKYNGPLEFESLLAAIAEAGDFTDIQPTPDLEQRKLRDTIDRSYRGAPAAGRALRDRFSADEIFQRLTASADEEIDRNVRLLFFSGVAAGTSIGATFFGRAVMTAAYPFDPIGLGNLLYPIGFVIIVLGGYQLFTENTLTPVTLVLTRLTSIPSLFRLWGIVLFANVVGAAAIAFIFARTGIFTPAVAEAAHSIGEHALTVSWSDLFYKAIIAGGLVATMVWVVHAARDTITRFFVVYLITFMIPAGDLFHCVTGALEVLYLVFVGSADLFSVFTGFFVPVVLGNTVGGVFFVAVVNFSMTADRRVPYRNRRRRVLNWSEWLLGSYAARLFSNE